MQTWRAILATSGMGKQGELLTQEALEQAARSINACYVPIGREHDPRRPPLGRVLRAWVAPTDNGVLALHGEIQFWEKGDADSPLAPGPRRLRAPDEPADLFEIHYDLPLERDLGLPFLNELAGLAGPMTKLRYEAKKAAEPLSSLLVVMGTFAIGAIAGGFLKKIGEDLYALLKSKLTEAMAKERSADRLLVLRAVVVNGVSRVCVDLVVTNPSDADMEALFASALPELDVAVERVCRDHGDLVAEIVTELEGKGLRTLYWVRHDGLPSVINPVSEEELERSNLSIAGTAEREEA